MNQKERHFEVVQKHLKHVKLTFTFISLSILLGISSIALLADIAHAQEEETTPTNQSLEERSTAVEARQEIMEERRAALAEKTQERITNLAANMSNRMEAAIARLQQINSRVDLRAEKLEAAGVDVSKAITHIDAANTSLNEATALISGIDEMIADVVTSENPREAWVTVRDTYRGIKTILLSAHESIRAAVAALKEAVTENENGVSDAVRNDNSDQDEEDGSEIIEETESDSE